MKHSLDQLKQQLLGQLQPLYFIHGDTTLLVNEAVDAIRQAAQQQGFGDRQRFQYERGFDWQQFLTASTNRSLFSQKQLFELKLSQADIGTAGRKTLQTYAQKPPKDTLLIISGPKLAANTTSSGWYKAIDKAGVTVPIWPIAAQQLPQWLRTRLQHCGLSTDAAGLNLLAETTQGNLLAAQQAIEKLRLLYGQGKLSADQIAASVHDNARFNIFELADVVLTGNAVKARRILASLRAENAEPVLILWALVKDTRALIEMAQALQQGQTLAQVTQALWAKRKPLMQNALRRVPLPQLYQRLQTAHQLDKQIKGVAQGAVWRELEDFVCWKTK